MFSSNSGNTVIKSKMISRRMFLLSVGKAIVIEDFKIMGSSSTIRQNLKNKSFENIASMLNSKIIKYIKENNLYA